MENDTPSRFECSACGRTVDHVTRQIQVHTTGLFDRFEMATLCARCRKRQRLYAVFGLGLLLALAAALAVITIMALA
ncbi:MAG: hypothetical protein NCW75_12200 [Phycisphaera sp.]|nr:MAG: hypothetical protein NCW75_12200 [Phycisphaera sp.]